jgi:hypothetical protein
MSRFEELKNYLPNDLINHVFKFVEPSPTAKLIKNKYIAYEPSTFNNIVDIKNKEDLKYEKRYEMIRNMNIIECHRNQRIYLLDVKIYFKFGAILCKHLEEVENNEINVFLDHCDNIIAFSSYNRKKWDYFKFNEYYKELKIIFDNINNGKRTIQTILSDTDSDTDTDSDDESDIDNKGYDGYYNDY